MYVLRVREEVKYFKLKSKYSNIVYFHRLETETKWSLNYRPTSIQHNNSTLVS